MCSTQSQLYVSSSKLSHARFAGTPVVEVLPPAPQRIPRELLHEIISSIRPFFDVFSPSTFTAPVFESRQDDFAVYLAEMKVFLTLRLVSRIWNAVMTPIVYQEFVIPTRFPVTFTGYSQLPSSSLLPALMDSRFMNSYSRVHKLVDFLGGDNGLVDSLASNMKTLVLYDFCHPLSSNDRSDESGLMTRILERFKDSDIRTLHCYGWETHAFRGVDWLRGVLPNLRSTLQNLSFDSADRNAISYALLTLGGSIKHLEIRNQSKLWDTVYYSIGDQASISSAEMPNLETLRLVRIATTLLGFANLFSIIGKRESGSLVDRHMQYAPLPLTSNLQSLTVTQLFVLNEDPLVGRFDVPLTADEFSQLLDTNGIAENLTYLYIGPGVSSLSDARNVIWRPETVTEIVKKCHRLISFSYTSIVHENLVDHLPSGLRDISLALRPSLSPPSHAAVSSYLHSLAMFKEFVDRSIQRKHRLGRLAVLVMDGLQRNPGFWRMSSGEVEVRTLLSPGRSELEVVCREAGIELAFGLI